MAMTDIFTRISPKQCRAKGKKNLKMNENNCNVRACLYNKIKPLKVANRKENIMLYAMLYAKSLLTTIAGRVRFDFEIMRNTEILNIQKHMAQGFNKCGSAFLKKIK